MGDSEKDFQLKLAGLLQNRNGMKILEAGCGSMSRINLPPGAYVTGVDVSEKQILENPSLHERIVGDVQDDILGENRFDAIVCWDVLEHLQEPAKAFSHFLKALKSEGLMILAFPNLLSWKGMITKFTPHAFHVWAYKTFFGVPDAGEEGVRPFRTFLRWNMRPSAVKRFAEKNDLRVEFFELYEHPMQKTFLQNHRFFAVFFALADFLARVISLGRMRTNRTDCLMILQKAQDAPSRTARVRENQRGE